MNIKLKNTENVYLKNENMTPREFREEQEFEFDHFQELTSTGIKPNYVNIELFAHEYHQAQLKLLGIADVVEQSEQLPNITLEQAIAKAKPNLDKITDVDKFLDDIR
jgi:hypothetical protein